jgi:hypothetical protein
MVSLRAVLGIISQVLHQKSESISCSPYSPFPLLLYLLLYFPGSFHNAALYRLEEHSLIKYVFGLELFFPGKMQSCLEAIYKYELSIQPLCMKKRTKNDGMMEGTNSIHRAPGF